MLWIFQDAAPYNQIVAELSAELRPNSAGQLEGDVFSAYPAGVAGTDGTSSQDIAINQLLAPGGQVGTADAYLTYEVPQYALSEPYIVVRGSQMSIQLKPSQGNVARYDWLVDGAPLGTTAASVWRGTAPRSQGTHTFRANLFNSSDAYLGNAHLDVDVQ